MSITATQHPIEGDARICHCHLTPRWFYEPCRKPEAERFLLVPAFKSGGGAKCWYHVTTGSCDGKMSSLVNSPDCRSLLLDYFRAFV